METKLEFLVVEKYSTDTQTWETAEMFHPNDVSIAYSTYQLLVRHGDTQYCLIKISLVKGCSYERECLESNVED